ncbi:MAG: acyl-CoA thioesterase [Flavobacteriaceae bacterium]|nr:MAG: acyl-CoA thioesterase [Flavobacteriaceae bacterium]
MKTPSDSLTILTNIILPSETNSLNNIFGGELLSRMDRIGSISARRHAGVENVVTASVNLVTFQQPIPMGQIATLEAKVSRVFSTSMEVIIDVFMEETSTGEKTQTNQGIFTFVAMDSLGKPIQSDPVVPQSQEEKIRYQDALMRREISLMSAGRIKPSQAIELKKKVLEE